MQFDGGLMQALYGESSISIVLLASHSNTIETFVKGLNIASTLVRPIYPPLAISVTCFLSPYGKERESLVCICFKIFYHLKDIMLHCC